MGLQISASGILNANIRQQAVANNIANVSTPGFQSQQVRSSDVRGGGVQIGSVSRDTSPGSVQQTGRALDVAAPEAFFQVRNADGSVGFTRDGSFSLNGQGQVVNASGAQLEPPIRVPANATGVTVTRTGEVFATTPNSLAPQNAGQIEVFTFANPQGLEAQGGGLFQATAASGPAQRANGAQVISGALEGSNVNLAQEQVNSLQNVNGFKANANAFRAQSDLLGELLNLASDR
jgi:flagellar basal-body rod protein FlgG